MNLEILIHTWSCSWRFFNADWAIETADSATAGERALTGEADRMRAIREGEPDLLDVLFCLLLNVGESIRSLSSRSSPSVISNEDNSILLELFFMLEFSVPNMLDVQSVSSKMQFASSSIVFCKMSISSRSTDMSASLSTSHFSVCSENSTPWWWQ